MKPCLSALDLSRLPLRVQVVAAILEAGRPLTLDEVVQMLTEAGASPRNGVPSLRRACRTPSCLVSRQDGRVDIDAEHPGYFDDRARIVRAARAFKRSPAAPTTRGKHAADASVDQWCAVRRCDKTAPHVSATWLGTRRSIGPLGREGADHDLVLWLDATVGEVRAFEVVPSGGAPEALGALLEVAVHTPLEPCRPAIPKVVAVDVVEGRLAVERTIEAHGGELVDLDVSPLDAVVARLRRELESPAMSLAEQEPERLRLFYAGCRTMLERRPWRGVGLHEAMRIEGLEPSPVYVLLVDSGVQGLVIFLDEEAALDTLLTRRPSSAPTLMIRYHPRSTVPAATAAAEVHGWDGTLVPLPMHLEGEKAKLVSGDEMQLLISVMEAVNGLQFDAPFLDQALALSDGRRIKASWPLLATPFGRRGG